MKNKNFPNHKTLYTFSLFLIFSFAFVLRIYHITENPNIINADEAGLGYNAWCLAHYGVDRYLNIMPVYPQNFEGGQSPLYTYLVVLLLKTVGRGNLSLLLIRIPGVISSMLVVLFGTLIIQTVYCRPRITLMGALLVSVCPYFIMHGRFALDCNLMLGCSTIALYLLLQYIKSGRLCHLVFYSVAFGFVMYSYALSYFVVPIFLCLITLSMLWCGKITLRRSILSAACVCITALPILLFIFALLFQLEPIKFFCFTISPIATARMADVGTSNFWENVIDIIKITLTHSFYPIDAVDKFYTMYFISIPFIIIGFFASCRAWFTKLKHKVFHPGFLFFSFYLSGLSTIGFCGTHYIYRANYFFIAYLYFLVCGIVSFYRFVISYRKFFIAAVSMCYFMWSFSFLRYYFTSYSMADLIPYPTSLYFIPAKSIIEHAQTIPDAQDIYIDYIGMTEYHYFYFPISPYELNGLPQEENHGRYYFSVNYYTPLIPGNIYISDKKNTEFIMNVNASEYTWQRIEYPYYYLFYCGDD